LLQKRVQDCYCPVRGWSYALNLRDFSKLGDVWRRKLKRQVQDFGSFMLYRTTGRLNVLKSIGMVKKWRKKLFSARAVHMNDLLASNVYSFAKIRINNSPHRI
jgi:hypothetical protein